MHSNWCGKKCCECSNPCELDESIPCSPDCPNLGPDGEHYSVECTLCEALENEISFHAWDSDDSQGTSMTCSRCGAHVVFDGSPEWAAILTEVCTSNKASADESEITTT